MLKTSCFEFKSSGPVLIYKSWIIYSGEMKGICQPVILMAFSIHNHWESKAG